MPETDTPSSLLSPPSDALEKAINASQDVTEDKRYAYRFFMLTPLDVSHIYRIGHPSAHHSSDMFIHSSRDELVVICGLSW